MSPSHLLYCYSIVLFSVDKYCDCVLAKGGKARLNLKYEAGSYLEFKLIWDLVCVSDADLLRSNVKLRLVSAFRQPYFPYEWYGPFVVLAVVSLAVAVVVGGPWFGPCSCVGMFAERPTRCCWVPYEARFRPRSSLLRSPWSVARIINNTV